MEGLTEPLAEFITLPNDISKLSFVYVSDVSTCNLVTHDIFMPSETFNWTLVFPAYETNIGTNRQPQLLMGLMTVWSTARDITQVMTKFSSLTSVKEVGVAANAPGR